ncbi:alpha/beta fold hydrolase [Mycobacterium manitobense]|uniref:Alpha/beta fold hydrolase n=1 Tax=[Mycobacterium] manitobense TaxID=190147 RepID=A0A9X2YS34_9MYCO|nr:alpha/beta fold hydrolase [[Mycobacterium] manitobense]MCV7172204.1 alpha/beta fold hydrolase [[Mycobacterium] manitobense]
MPETRYALSGDVHVAFQMMGDGHTNLVYIPGWVSHLELELENGLSRLFYETLASFTTLVRFDKRGTGMSDRIIGTPSLEERMDDIRAVVDAAGIERASLFGFSEGGTMAAIFAARHPDRVEKLVLFASHAGKVTGSPDFPCGYESEQKIHWLEDVIQTRWGAGDSLEHLAPSLWRHRQADRARAGMARFERMAASPGTALALFRANIENDARSVLPLVEAPTLVLHRAGDRFVHPCNGEHLAATIPDARLIVVDGDDHLPYVGDTTAVLREVERFLVGTTHHAERLRGRPGVVGDPLISLSPAELRVAECVAQGMANPAIAKTLHLSRHTVESHLKRIYAKLGVTRIQLAAVITAGTNR